MRGLRTRSRRLNRRSQSSPPVRRSLLHQALLLGRCLAQRQARLTALKGKVAIANAKLAYQEYLTLFAGARWDKLKAKGVKPQRLLWASTGVKSKD